MLIDEMFDWGKSIIRTIIFQVEHKILHRVKFIVFYIGVIIFMLARMNAVVKPIVESSYLVGQDDSYSYILKGIQTETCFLQDCLALEDLREQLLIPTPDVILAQERYRQYARLFTYYVPLYAIIFSGVHSYGFSPETTHYIIVIAGAILINLAICYWLYTAWDPGAAGITLGILAFSVLGNGHGLVLIKPTDMALGIAIISWTILLRNSKHKYWAVPLCILAMSGMHSIGQIYAIISFILLLLLSEWPLNKRMQWGAGISLLIIISLFFLLPLVQKPDFSRFDPTRVYTGEWSRGEILLQSLDRAIIDLNWWGGSSRWGFLSTGILIFLGFTSTPRRKRNGVLAMGGLLGGLLVLSLFYIVPWWPAIITRRVWLPVRLFFFGAIGLSFWLWGKTIIEYLIRYVHQYSKYSKGFNLILSFLSKGIFILTVFIFIFLYQSYTNNKWLNGTQYKYAIKSLTYPDRRLDPSQPELLLSQIEKDDVVLYMHEIFMYFFMSHGAMQNRTVFYSAVANSPEQKVWIDENDDIRYIVALNPINIISNYKGEIPIIKSIQLFIESESLFNLSSVELLLTNRGNKDEKLLMMISGDDDNVMQILITIPARTSGWFPLTNKENIWVDQIKFSIETKQKKLFLEGLHIQENELLNWPWGQDVILKLKTPGSNEETLAVASFNNIIQDAGLDLQLQLQVIADDGVSVLAKVIR